MDEPAVRRLVLKTLLETGQALDPVHVRQLLLADGPCADCAARPVGVVPGGRGGHDCCMSAARLGAPQGDDPIDMFRANSVVTFSGHDASVEPVARATRVAVRPETGDLDVTLEFARGREALADAFARGVLRVVPRVGADGRVLALNLVPASPDVDALAELLGGGA